jgi:CRP-like cAMP-binding protein
MTENSDENQCYLTNREEISNILGLTVETTSRTMAEFKRQGLIEEHQRKSIRCDTAALEKIANAD